MKRTFHFDIKKRLSLMIHQLANRLNETNIFKIKKQYPNLSQEVAAIEESHQERAISALLEMYRMRHTMQIIRYMNLNRGEFSMESYITISGALARFIIKENKIMNEM